MKHSFIDEYSGLDSLIHHLDPRTKVLSCLAFVLAVILTPAGNWKVFGFYFLLIWMLIILSRLPLLYVLKRSLLVFPFTIMLALFIPFFKDGQELAGFTLGALHIRITYEGVAVLINVAVRSWLAMLSLILLSSSTSLADLLAGLQKLGMPRVFILIISFMYRYIFVLADQVMRMKQARDSRNFGGNNLYQYRVLGNMIGILFVRSYERGERIYAAMLSRGYNGDLPAVNTFSLRRADACFALAMGILLICPAVLWW